MSYRLLLSIKAGVFLKKLNKSDKKRIESRLKDLACNPELGKPLVGKLAGLWSLRMGDYRAIYEIKYNELLILVLKLGHRKNVYDLL
jgi:mRNA interferase RelE/StbE